MNIPRVDEGLALGREAIALSREVLPPAHPLRVRTAHDVIQTLVALPRHDEAAALIDEMLAEVGPDHPLSSGWRTTLEELR